MNDGPFEPTPIDAIEQAKDIQSEAPFFVPTWMGIGGTLYLADPADDPAVSFRAYSERERGVGYNKKRETVELTLNERWEHHTARIHGESTEDIPMVDLRSLPKGLPPVEEIVLLVNKHEQLPFVDHDLIPE